jgi:hypothetical protein
MAMPAAPSFRSGRQGGPAFSRRQYSFAEAARSGKSDFATTRGFAQGTDIARTVEEGGRLG